MVGPAVTHGPLAIPLGRTPESVPTGARERHRRTRLVAGIGEEGLSRIRAARVLVVGAGGLGSPVLLYLAAAGVGRIGIADFDLVDVTNLQRQVLHPEAGVGRPKADTAAERLADLNSEVETARFGRVTREWLDAHGREWDLVVECTDSFDAKYLVADWCASAGLPFVWGTVVGASYQVAAFWSAAPAPAPSTRLRDLHPAPPAPGSTPVSTEAGVLGPVVGEAGTAMATEALKLIAGFGSPLIGRVLVVDAARRRFDVLEFAPWEDGS